MEHIVLCFNKGAKKKDGNRRQCLAGYYIDEIYLIKHQYCSMQAEHGLHQIVGYNF